MLQAPEDLSDLVTSLEVKLKTLAFQQVQSRLKDYVIKCEELGQEKYGNWRNLPKKALESLETKIKNELESNV